MWNLQRKLDRGIILSALVISFFDREPQSPERKIELEDLSKKLAELMDAQIIDLSDFDISPGGEYSDDIARFVGNYLLAGYAEKRSPLIFFPTGLDMCRSNLRRGKDDPGKSEELKKIANFLHIDLNKIN